ncbi:hypothetical protein SLEP1_g30284 [Rubroshorea leprosula]|uniref:Uncharacterized protein n=1 Tax=Rubroshorea leprosula TaxID=152421 RepID=A0AAV5K5B4_9ROSI|nr:hypothetical protein SLEP1_g30284 [Rubroshorea leprosula]
MASSSNSRSSGLEASSGVRDFGLIEHTYERRQMFCEFGLKAPRWTSWRPWSIGRRFYGFPNFLNADLRCAYFVWHDFELTIERDTELLKLLINEKKYMSNEIAALKRQLKQRKLGGTVPVLDESPVSVESSLPHQVLTCKNMAKEMELNWRKLYKMPCQELLMM